MAHRREMWRGVACTLLCLGTLTACTVPGTASAPRGAGQTAPTVDSLLRRMTLAEKVGQMTLISVSRLWGNCAGAGGPLNDSCLRHVLIDRHVGAILSGGGEAPVPNTPSSWASMTNRIQRYAVDHSRLHIPILYGADAVHGHNNVLGATIFPHNIGLAATWDPGIARQVAADTARDARATGVRWTFAPVSDLARDIRWGRYYETFGEDPYLAAGFVAAEVRGLQGAHPSSGVAATLKHFIGYSQPLNGMDRTAAELPMRYIQENYVPPFEAGVQAGALSVMAQSGSMNGMPVHASHRLLTTLLRTQMGFNGFVVSDWGDVDALYTRYHLARSEKDATRLAILAGVDMAMVPYDTDTFTSDLIDLVRTGKIPQSRIDDAVRRILRAKEATGLFSHPYVDAAAANATVRRDGRSIARHAAEESIVLLKNDAHTLPLRTGGSLLVTGSSANSLADQMGGWTLGWQGVPDGEMPPGTTVLRAIEEAAGTRHLTYVPGDRPAEAAAKARKAGRAVVVVGEKPYAEGAGDTTTADLLPGDRALLDAVLRTGTPTVVVILAGRPLMMSGLIQRARAVLMAWLPGTEGGPAVADALFGRTDPGGRLPVTWPRSIGQVPAFYSSLPGTNLPGQDYAPLFPFGWGLSYTTFSTTFVGARGPKGRNGTIAATLRVRNRGTAAGDDVVQIDAHPDDASVLVPTRRLVGYRRVHLEPGQTRLLTLTVPTEALARVPGDVDADGRAIVQPGRYTLTASGHSRTVTVP